MGYLFIMAIEILALMLKHSIIKQKNKKGTCNLMGIYADDLIIYLERRHNNRAMNLRNVQEAMRIMETFQRWSRLRGIGDRLTQTYSV